MKYMTIKGNKTKDEILVYIRNYIMLHSYPPTLGEMVNDLNLSKTTISHHINCMLDAGTLESDDRSSSRALRIPGVKIIMN